MNQTNTENTHSVKLDLRLFDMGAEVSGQGAEVSGQGSEVSGQGGEASSQVKASEVGFRDRRKGAAERERMARAALHGTGDISTESAEKARNTTASHKGTGFATDSDKDSGFATASDRKSENPTKAVETVENPTDYGTEKGKSGGEAQLDRLMKDPDFRRAFSERAQSMIDKRFKEYKGLQAKYEALSPIIEALSEKYGTAKGDIGALVRAFGADTALSSGFDIKTENAAKADIGADIPTENRKTRENAANFMENEARRKSREAVKRINAEALALGELYSDFDLKKSLADPKIREMLKSGVSLKAAYEAANIDKILRQRTAAAEKRVLENIKARNGRPLEGGANAQSGAVAQNLSPKLTRQDRERLAQRAIRGERVSL